MKSYDKNEILAKFEEAMRLLGDPAVDDKKFGIVYAALSISLQSRITELKRGRSRSARVEKELAQLSEASNCFTSKINTAKKSEMGRELVQAYKVFGNVHENSNK